MLKIKFSFYRPGFLYQKKRIVFICSVFMMAFVFNSVLMAQDIEQLESKKGKKVKLPPEDLAGPLLKNAQYNFHYSTLKGVGKKEADKKGEESISLQAVGEDQLQTASVGTGGLVGVSINNPTSIQFGPDDRLYVSQQNGLILALTIIRNGPNDYSVTASETISLVKQIPNHDDNGVLNTSITSRQVTGILLTGTADRPIIYVSSSDSRIGGGSTAGDKNLDTNSGILSRLTKTGSGWEKMDLVRGFPRSEENHAVNGMQLNEETNTLYLAVGGFTNAGSPSNNFAFICEYALSAAILSIDLDAIDALPTSGSGNNAYKYDLPTLDDPTRTNNPDGSDVNDPFGGNDGLNQAIIVQGGPVQIFSPGYRNAYDLVITKTPGRAGRIYTIDNGANQGWGGHPENEGSDGTVTNNYVEGEPGSTGAGPNDPRVNNLDNLHYIGSLDTYIPGSYYGGHPTPTRANPGGAGLYTHDGTSGVWRTSTTGTHPLPADWPPLPLSMANPIEGDFRNPGETDGALLTFTSSTNGVVEYTASNFDNTLKGHLLAASYDGDIYKITLTEDGTGVTNTRNSTNQLNGDLPFASGFGSRPLDLAAQGDLDIFPGTVWAATYGSDAITIFEPAEYMECSGQYSTDLDEDGDGFSNADEIDNGSNPCSAASRPQDSDGDFLSDLNDGDDDNDGLGDNTDFFALDQENGLSTTLPVEYDLFNNHPGTGLFGLGFSGLMSNQQVGNDYLNLFEEENLIAGGAVGAFSVVAVSAGDALGDLNNQENAFQFGLNVNADTWPFTVHSSMLGPFFNNQTPQNDQSQGLYIGTGDQDNYLKIVLNANGGQGGIELVYENAGVPIVQQFGLEGGIPGSNLDLYLSVNPVTGTVQAKFSKDGGGIIALGTPVQLSGLLLEAVQGAPAIAVGIISTSRNAEPFTATWDLINITTDPVTSSGQWNTVAPANGAPTERHENAFVQAGDKLYLLGGRGLKPVEEYDPREKSWMVKGSAPLNFNHFQAVSLEGLIYVLGAFTSGYPHEVPVPDIYIYNPLTDKWIKGPAIPESRRRGSAGVVTYQGKIYMVGGIVDGHWEGWVPWFDEYDPSTNSWKSLTDAPRPRDHFQAAVIENKLYLAGGRRTSGSTNELYNLTVPEVDVYDFLTGEWNTLPPGSNIPTERAGAAIAVIENELIVMGGESIAQSTAHKETEALNVKTNSWRSIAQLQEGRHGTQAIVSNNSIYVVAGSGSRGGSPELSSLESFYFFSPTEPVGTALDLSNLEAPSQEDFGIVKTGDLKKIPMSITNTAGNQAIVLSSISISGNSSFTFEAPFILPFVIPAGKSVELLVQFAPTSNGLQSADLVLAHSGTGSSTVVSLSGEGQSEGLVPSPTKLHFFSQQAGTTSEPKLLRLINHEINQVEVLSVSLSGYNSSEFAHSFTEATIITAGDSLDLFVTFSPASLGTKVADLTIEHSGTNSPLIVAISGEGHDNPEETVVYRLNSGGEEVTSPEGDFAKDQYFTPQPGHTFSTSGTISGTTNQAIYQSERSATTNNGTFSYAIPVPAGLYKVVLHFAEIYWKDPGKRVFDVNIEEVKMLDNYDIVVKAGGSMAAVQEAFYVEVADEVLDIFFSAMESDGGVNRPKISAIEVFSVDTESNQIPVAHAGDDQLISLPTNSVVLSGSGTDANGTITAYQWKQESGPGTADFSSLTIPDPTVSGLLEGIYVFSLTVTDNDGGVSAADEVLVTVQPQEVEGNQLPLVDAGDDKIITLPLNSTSFTATASDPDGSIASYSWITLSSPSGSTVTLAGESTANLDVTVDLAGAYTFQVTVTDDKGATASDQVNLTVNEATSTNTAPVANAGVDQSITLPTNSVVLSGSGTDSDGTISAYSWSQDSGPGTATFSSTSVAAPTVSDLLAGTYVFSLTVTDDKGAVSAPDQVSVVVNEAGTFLAAPSKLTAVGVSNSQINLNWQDNTSEEEGFVLERATKSNFTGKVDYYNISANTTSYQNIISNTKKGGGVYYYRIKAVKGSASSEYSNVASATATATAASISQVRAYPNTFDKFVNLEFQGEKEQKYDVKVYDLLGKILYEGTFAHGTQDVIVHRIDLSNPSLGKGIYLIQVENRKMDFREVIRIIKIK